MSIKIALAGNPNSGKTTLFNALTGSNQYVGNWPGVTVEKKEGRLKTDKEITIIDLPGIYSLSPYSLEEVVTRNYLINECPDIILNIVDGTNLERNLYLSTQLLELGIPVVIAVNMLDLLEKNKVKINTEKLSEFLGCEVMEVSALKGMGVHRAAEQSVETARKRQGQALVHRFSEPIEQAIDAIQRRMGDTWPKPLKRFYSIKLLEKDQKVLELFQGEIQTSKEIEQLETLYDDDTESIITNERYCYITSIIDLCSTKKSRETKTPSDKIDQIVTNRFLALPIFAFIMFLVYYISITTVGNMVTDWTNNGLFGEGFLFFGKEIPGIPIILQTVLDAVGCAQWLSGLIVDGIAAGVFAVLGFVPQMLVLFAFLAFLESCGYMARVAFIMDRLFRKFGLSGKSFIPMLIGSGCGVPGIMASRTIENERDRKMTIITTTFIPCGAKLPIIALIAGALFSGAWWVAPSAYFIGIAAVVCSGIILKKTRLFAGDVAPFVMELPAYHMPTARNILKSMWERGWSFVKKAGTIILVSSVILWFFMSFGVVNGSFLYLSQEQLDHSILAYIGGLIAPVFSPLGWGDWRSAVAAVTGLIAKENVVGSFGILYGFADISEHGTELYGVLAGSMSALAAYSFLTFNLLCAPCFAAMGAIKREMKHSSWFWFAVLYQIILAYVVSLCIYQIGMVAVTGEIVAGSVTALVLIVVFIYLLVRPKETKGRFVMKRRLARAKS